jgi:hypothetical protein
MEINVGKSLSSLQNTKFRQELGSMVMSASFHCFSVVQ